MAVLRTNREWTTYQDKQLKALEDIEDVLNDTYKYSSKIPGEFDSTRDVLYNCTSLIIESIDAIWNSKDLPVFPKFSDPENVKIFKDTLDDTTKNLESAIEDIGSEDPDEDPDEYKMTFFDYLGDFNDLLDDFNDSVRDLADYFSKIAGKVDGYTKLMNDTIRYTGATQDEAQQFRRDIVDGVSDLNAEVGGLFNPEEVLSQMIAISDRSHISNMDTLKEITTPLMLAQETLNTDIGSMAKTFGKFYTRYSFTSGDMEELVDHLRNTSKGKDVSEQAMVEAIASLENSIHIYAGGDTSKQEALQKDVASAVAYLQSNYIDPSSYIEDLHAFFSTDATEHNAMYRKYSNADEIESLLQSGDVGKAIEAMVSNIGTSSANIARARGIDTGVWEEATVAMMTDLESYEEFLASIDKSTSARESVEDKHVNVAERIENKLSEVTSYLATLQENVGIGFSDVASMLYIGQNLKGILGGVLSSKGLVMKGAGAGAGALSGVLGSMGTILGVGGAALGIAAVVKGIYDIIETDEDEGVGDYQDPLLTSSEDAPYGKGKVEVYDPETDTSSYVWKAFESQEEADKYNADEALESDIKSDYEDKPWYEKLVDTVLTGFYNQGINQMNQSSMINEALGLANPGVMDTSDSIYADQRRSIDDVMQDILKQTQGKDSEAVRLFYAENNLLDELDEAKHFLANLKTYEEYYAQGYYYSYNKGKWYSIKDNENDETAKSLPEFEVGTNYIPKDQLAYLHEGEAVVPAEYNPVGNMNELERLRQESKEKDTRNTAEIVEAILEVSEFLKSWKTSNDKKDIMNDTRSSMLTPERIRALSYQL